MIGFGSTADEAPSSLRAPADERPVDRKPGAVALEGVAVFLVFAAIAIWQLWPVPTVWWDHSAYAGAEVPAVVADYYLILWALAWDTHALLTSPLHLFDANIFHPAQLSLAYSEHFLGYVPLFAPTYLLTGNPIFAINVMVFLTFPLSAVAAYALARRWLGRPAAFLVGFLFAFCPFRLAGLAHSHQLGVQYLPLVILLTERWFDRGRMRDLVFLAAAIALQTLSSFYLAYALVLAYGAYLLIALVAWRGSLDGRRLGGLVVAGGIGMIPMLVTSLPYLQLQRLGIIPSYEQDGVTRPLALEPYWATKQVIDYVEARGVGAVGYLLGLVALLPPWRRIPRWPVAIGAVFAAVGVLVSFGGTILAYGREIWSPYQLLAHWVPGLATVRMPGRFVVIAQLGFALLAGIGLDRLLRRIPAAAGWPVALTAIGLAVWTFAPQADIPLHREQVGSEVPEPYRWLAEHGEERPLLEIPASAFIESGRRMYWSTYHRLPITSGYSGYTPSLPYYVANLAGNLPAPKGLQELVDQVDVGWILVQHDKLDEKGRLAWQGPLPEGLERVGRWGDRELFAVTRPVVRNRRDTLIRTDLTPSGVPLARLSNCPGELTMTTILPDPWPSTKTVGLQVVLHNRGDHDWPGFGFYPRHLVQVRTTLRRDGMVVQTFPRRSLPADARAGTALSLLMALTPNAPPGDYELEFELVQNLDGSMADCGVAPLRVPIRIGRS